MITVTKQFEFEAAHCLENHPGKCKHLHGHSYKLEVEVAGEVLSETGMIIDFGDLKAIVNEQVVEKLDHRLLNEVFNFPATAENMVKWIADQLEDRLAEYSNVELVRVRLWETSSSYAEYYI